MKVWFTVASNAGFDRTYEELKHDFDRFDKRFMDNVLIVPMRN